MIRTFSVGLALALGAGCAASSQNLTQDEIDRMPYEARLAIYDGENDVVIARSRSDEAAHQIAAFDRDLDELERRLDRTVARLKKANFGDRVSAVKKAVAARRKYLEAQKGVAEAALRSAEVSVAVARARLDATKQRQLGRTGRVTPGSIDAYDANVAALEKWEKATQRRELDIRVETQKVFETWKLAEEEYARASGDFDSGIWID